MAKKTTRRSALSTFAFGGMVAFALAVPAVSAAAPSDAGRISWTDENRTRSVWPDGTHNVVESWHAAGWSIVGNWNAAGTQAAAIEVNNRTPYIFDDGGTTIARTVSAPGGETIIDIAIGPDGQRTVMTSDASVTINNNGLNTQIFPSTGGRVSWSAEGTDGTIIWDGYESGNGDPGSGPGIPGGDLPGAPSSADGNGTGIMMVKQLGAPTEIVTDTNASNPSISKDGRTVAYSSNNDIYWVDLSEQNPVPTKLAGSTLNADDMPTVSPDGTKIAFASGNYGEQDILVAPTAGGAAVKVADTDTVQNMAWQPVVKAAAGTVTVSGTAKVGETLTTGGDAATGTAPLTTGYQWQRCTDLPPESDGCVDIPGATASSYTVTADDKGYKLRVKRTATNAGGTQTATSSETAVVTDAGGNVPDPTPVDSVKPDQPVFSNGPDSLDTDTTPTFEWDGAEQGGKFQCQIVGDLAAGDETATAWADCTSPFTTPELAVGSHSFRVRQVDDANNVGDYRQYDWTITAPQQPNNPTPTDPTPTPTDPTPVDSTGPAAPTLDAVPKKKTNKTEATFDFSGAEVGGRYECFVADGEAMGDGPAWQDCTSPATFPNLTEGVHTFYLRQVDDADNPGQVKTFTWEIDLTEPAAPTFTKKPADATFSTTAVFEWTGSGEEGSGIQCRLDPMPNEGVSANLEPSIHDWHPCGSPQQFDNLAVGAHRFEVRERDAAGNYGPAAFYEWVVNPVPPVVDPPVVTPPVVEQPVPETPKPVEKPAVETPAPVVQAPAVEAPKAEAPKAEEPKKETPKPVVTPVKPPALTAVIGGAKTGAQVGANGGTSSAATIEVAKEAVGVGCSITGTVLKSCKVDLYAPKASGARAHAAAAEQVLVGTGTYESKNGSEKMDVRIELNATGKAMLRANPGGLKVTVKISGQPVAGPALKATGVAKLVTDRAAATVGGFAVNSAVLTAKAKADLRKLARFGKAASVRCVGHTDGSTDDESYLQDLGARRAKAVCGYLTRLGVKAGKRTLVSKADRVPAATNATKAGRAKNRRVQVTLVR
jgi:outer membrane protein OmpA-like peptidoglycan-associated protein